MAVPRRSRTLSIRALQEVPFRNPSAANVTASRMAARFSRISCVYFRNVMSRPTDWYSRMFPLSSKRAR
jgi:hypothetical protein